MRDGGFGGKQKRYSRLALPSILHALREKEEQRTRMRRMATDTSYVKGNHPSFITLLWGSKNSIHVFDVVLP